MLTVTIHNHDLGNKEKSKISQVSE
jgi:hypothetical protein